MESNGGVRHMIKRDVPVPKFERKGEIIWDIPNSKVLYWNIMGEKVIKQLKSAGE